MNAAHRRLLVCALTISALALRFWRLGEMPLFGDEAYYLLWTKHLALSYFDHPAGIAFLLKLSTLLGGASEFGVRWLNALLSAAGVPLAYAVGRRYVSPRGGLIAAAAVALSPVYVITGRVAYPDSLHDFLLLTGLVIGGPLLIGSPGSRKAATRRGLCFGVILALLLNVKLTTGFFGIAVALYVLTQRRDLLRARGLWWAAGISLLGAAPIVIWNVSHDWGMLRLTVQQGANYGLPAPTLLAAWFHAVRYLTPPAAILALLAVVTYLRRPHSGDGPRFLVLAATCTLLPILFSAANSPRNLGWGLLLVWPLVAVKAAPAADRPNRHSQRRLGGWITAVCLAGSAIYAIGTVAARLGPATLLRSSGASAIREDAAGWPALAREAILPEGISLFAVDYNIAGQLSYYTGRPVYSAAGQFRAWGIPESDDLLVLSQGFVPDEMIEAVLRASFSSVEAPKRWFYSQNDFTKKLRIWSAHGRHVAMEQVIADLDYLTLARQAAQGR